MTAFVHVGLWICFARPMVAQESCFECHAEPDLSTVTESGEEVSLYVDSTAYALSVHGDFECVDCHSDIQELPHEERLQKVDCAECHDDVVTEYQAGVHGQALAAGIPEAPACADCHGKHDILSAADPASRVHPLNLANTCAACHADPAVVQKFHIPVPNPLAVYRTSVHGTAVLSENNFEAATCASCHGSHDIRPMSDSKSPIYWKNVPETCGTCHEEIFVQYTKSVHWQAALQGIRQVPVCTDCHGEHQVRSPRDPESPVHPLRVSRATCERCHASELLSERYGIPELRVKTFEDSYHGLAIKGGSLSAANCASCHGVHNILPSSDPESTIHPANLVKTCGGCHPNATENFAKGPVHLTTSVTPGRVVFLVQRIYVILIVVVIGAMLLHNGVDFVRRCASIVRQRLQA